MIHMVLSLSRTACLMLLFLAVSCKVSKDTSAPKASVPGQFRSAKPADSSNSVARLSWKSFFKEPALKNLIDTALVRNFDMQVALKNTAQAQLLLKQAKLGYFPELRLSVGASTNYPSSNTLTGISIRNFLGTTHIEDFIAGGALSWEADIWGKVRNQKRSALAGYLQTEEARKLIQTNLISQISQGYYQLLMLDAQLEVAKRNVSLNDSTLTMMRLQYTSGQVSNLGILQAEAQQQQASQLVPQLEQSIAVQENALSVLAGQVPATRERGVVLAALQVPDSLAAGIPAEMVSRRPDVKSTEHALQIANARVGIAKANMYPVLSITASGGVNSLKAVNWFTLPASLFGIAGAGLTQPLFLRKQLRTQYKVALLEREKAVLEFRKSVLNAVGEVSDALVKLEKLKEQQRIAALRVTTLHKAIANAELLFKSGLANYLEVITVQSNKLEAELQLASIQRQHLGATVELYKALGGGWN